MNENLNQLVILVFGGAGLITLPIICIGMYLEWKCKHENVTVDWLSLRFKTRCNKCLSLIHISEPTRQVR
jgi:hypothetical protein